MEKKAPTKKPNNADRYLETIYANSFEISVTDHDVTIKLMINQNASHQLFLSKSVARALYIKLLDDLNPGYTGAL